VSLQGGEAAATARGGGTVAAASVVGGSWSLAAALEGGDPWGAVPPCPPSSLDLLGAVEEPSPLEMAAKGELIS
jgi:hypothetical protein